MHFMRIDAYMSTAKMHNDKQRVYAYINMMDELQKLHIKYLEDVKKKCEASSLTALAKKMKLNPSTFNRFGKLGGQSHLSAPTLDKLHSFSGIAPPTTKAAAYEVDIDLLAETIQEVLEILDNLPDDKDNSITLERKCKTIAARYNEKIKKLKETLTYVIKMDNKS